MLNVMVRLFVGFIGVHMKYRMLDLFSGLGGASEAFVQSKYWEVVRIENNPLCADVECTQIIDINVIHANRAIYAVKQWDLIWASPPCTQFSKARVPQIKNPDLGLVKKTIEIIEALNPRYWIIENVDGAIKHFMPLLGPPRLKLGPYCLWGNFPLFNVNMKGYSKMDGDTWSDDPLRPQKRAYVPFKISEALRQSIQYQSTLVEFNEAKATNR